MWKFSDSSRSWAATSTGAHDGSAILGSPSRSNNAANKMPRWPRLRQRSISRTDASTSQNGNIISGTSRRVSVPANSARKSLYASTHLRGDPRAKLGEEGVGVEGDHVRVEHLSPHAVRVEALEPRLRIVAGRDRRPASVGGCDGKCSGHPALQYSPTAESSTSPTFQRDSPAPSSHTTRGIASPSRPASATSTGPRARPRDCRRRRSGCRPPRWSCSLLLPRPVGRPAG